MAASQGDLARSQTVDLETNARAKASTFGVIAGVDLTIPQLIQYLIDGQPLDWPDDAEANERAVLERLAKATSGEQLFGEQQANGWGELLDVPVEVHGYRLLPGTMEGAVCFAVVDVYRLDEGEPDVVTTGAKGVLVQLLQGTMLGLVPGVFKLTEVGQEKKGRSRPQRLVRLGDLPASSTAA